MPTPEEIVIAALQKLDVPYELIDIDPRFADTAAFCEKYGYPAERSCNTPMGPALYSGPQSRNPNLTNSPHGPLYKKDK
jgi:hypothetical protein